MKCVIWISCTFVYSCCCCWCCLLDGIFSPPPLFFFIYLHFMRKNSINSWNFVVSHEFLWWTERMWCACFSYTYTVIFLNSYQNEARNYTSFTVKCVKNYARTNLYVVKVKRTRREKKPNNVSTVYIYSA